MEAGEGVPRAAGQTVPPGGWGSCRLMGYSDAQAFTGAPGEGVTARGRAYLRASQPQTSCVSSFTLFQAGETEACHNGLKERRCVQALLRARLRP